MSETEFYFSQQCGSRDFFFDIGVPVEGSLALMLWDCVFDVVAFHLRAKGPPPILRSVSLDQPLTTHSETCGESLDGVPNNIVQSLGRAQLFLLVDSAAVIRMATEERSPN